MTPAEFKRKWSRYEGKESSAYQEHFGDLCRLLQQPTPAEADPSGSESFCFQKRVVKDAELLELDTAGGDEADPEERGFADVWKKDCFGWEYKGKKKNLDEAYKQLLRSTSVLMSASLVSFGDLRRRALWLEEIGIGEQGAENRHVFAPVDLVVGELVNLPHRAVEVGLDDVAVEIADDEQGRIEQSLAVTRLENRRYDVVCFRNGYASKAPEMLVEWRGVRKYGTVRNGYYAIRLGRILKITRWRGERTKRNATE